MAEYCAIGQCIMDLFTAYIERKNAENFNKLDYETFKQGKHIFKPAKSTQAELSKLLDNNTSNISAYLKGQIKIPKEMVLDITEKFELNCEDFLKLAKQFTLQETELISSDVKSINELFIKAVTANLLYELTKRKAFSDKGSNYSKIISKFDNSWIDVKEIASSLLGEKK